MLWLLLCAPAAAQTPPPKPVAKTHKAHPAPVVVPHSSAPAQPAPSAPAPSPSVAAPPPAPGIDAKGTVTGLKLPRWAALRADDVNLRIGPGMQFPIDWQYHRRDLPVRILREVDVWRLVQDQDGQKGWVQHANLVSRRSFVIKGAEAVMRETASDTVAAVARLEPGVVGRIRACEAAAAWCEVQVGSHRGWLRREQFWGADPDEAIGN